LGHQKLEQVALSGSGLSNNGNVLLAFEVGDDNLLPGKLAVFDLEPDPKSLLLISAQQTVPNGS
jgi:hypothetical protein